MDLRWVSNPATFYPMAPNQGFEPRPFESESNVLPLHQFGRLAGAGGFEPPNTGSKPAALPITLRPYMVRVEGLEPPTSCSQSRRATNCATPGNRQGSLFCIALPTKLSARARGIGFEPTVHTLCMNCCTSLYMELVEGVEPTTPRLQGACSAIELHQHLFLSLSYIYIIIYFFYKIK